MQCISWHLITIQQNSLMIATSLHSKYAAIECHRQIHIVCYQGDNHTMWKTYLFLSRSTLFPLSVWRGRPATDMYTARQGWVRPWWWWWLVSPWAGWWQWSGLCLGRSGDTPARPAGRSYRSGEPQRHGGTEKNCADYLACWTVWAKSDDTGKTDRVLMMAPVGIGGLPTLKTGIHT